ncbi:MAG: hypothetical protein VXZ13_15370, partial [Pseudomonadota bacterium]|nr:hypothetical protein [Pseudomonadota bacterium]
QLFQLPWFKASARDMNELANIPGNIVVVLTQQGITNARSSEEDHLKRFITILRGDYKSGKKILLFLTNWSAIIHAYKRSSIITNQLFRH